MDSYGIEGFDRASDIVGDYVPELASDGGALALIPAADPAPAAPQLFNAGPDYLTGARVHFLYAYNLLNVIDEDVTVGGGVEMTTKFREIQTFDIGGDYIDFKYYDIAGKSDYFLSGNNVGPWFYEIRDKDHTLPKMTGFVVYRNGVQDDSLRSRVSIVYNGDAIRFDPSNRTFGASEVIRVQIIFGPSLFTTDADTKNLNALSSADQTKAAADSDGLYSSMGGNDDVTLPDTNHTNIATGVTWDFTRFFHGGAGNDTIRGGNGADHIDGGDGNDTLLGGDGNDVITDDAWDSGSQSYTGTIDGGAGFDTLDFTNTSDVMTIRNSYGEIVWSNRAEDFPQTNVIAANPGEILTVDFLTVGGKHGSVNVRNVEQINGMQMGGPGVYVTGPANGTNEPDAPGATATMTFTIHLTSRSAVPVSVNWGTASGTARAGSDYIAAGGTVTFGPNETTKIVTVQILGDSISGEQSEQFSVVLLNPINTRIIKSSVVATINDSDSPPTDFKPSQEPTQTIGQDETSPHQQYQSGGYYRTTGPDGEPQDVQRSDDTPLETNPTADAPRNTLARKLAVYAVSALKAALDAIPDESSLNFRFKFPTRQDPYASVEKYNDQTLGLINNIVTVDNVQNDVSPETVAGWDQQFKNNYKDYLVNSSGPLGRLIFSFFGGTAQGNAGDAAAQDEHGIADTGVVSTAGTPTLGDQSFILDIDLTGTPAPLTMKSGYSDTFSGSVFGDEVHLGDLNDVAYGAGGNDRLFGDAGRDILFGGDGDDQLFGGDGNDILVGDAGDDTMTGGVGDDTYYVEDSTDAIIEAAGAGTDTVMVRQGSYTLPANVENGISVSPDGVTIRGNSGDNVLTGGAGGDLLLIQDGGKDTVRAGAGNDSIYFGAGYVRPVNGVSATTVDGGVGFDQIAFQGNYPYANGTQTIALGSYNIANVEEVVLLSGKDARFGDTGGNLYKYSVGIADSAVAAKQWLIVDGSGLAKDESFFLDASQEKDGNLIFLGGKGQEILGGGMGTSPFGGTSGQGINIFFFGPDRFNQSDFVEGSANGRADYLLLQGNYTGSSAMKAGFGFEDIESIVLLSGSDQRFGFGGGPYSYELTMDNSRHQSTTNTSLNFYVFVDGTALAGNETLTFNATASKTQAYFVRGGAGNDIITGSDALAPDSSSGLFDVIDGGDGNDVLTGVGTGDRIIGGMGADRIVNAYFAIYNSIAESTVAAPDTVIGSPTFDLLRIDANTQLAGQQTFTFIGANAFSGKAGELRVVNDTTTKVAMIYADVDGDGQADFAIRNEHPLTTAGPTASSFRTGSPINTDASWQGTLTVPINGGVPIPTDFGTVTAHQVNTVSGTAAVDTLHATTDDDIVLGFAGNDKLFGEAGNDRLDGGTGADTMQGDAGDDVFLVDDAGDKVVEFVNEGTDTVLASVSWTLGAGQYVEILSAADPLATVPLTLIGNERDNSIIGNAGANILQGGAGNDDIDGGAGADQLYGGLGNDTFHADRQDDIVFEAAGQGTDTVIATSNYYLYANIENLTLGGTGDFFGVGNDLANVIAGNDGNNLLLGGAGDDVVLGGDGIDLLYGETGDDHLDGGSGNDVLIGGAGNDTMDGGRGGDSLYGEAGDDILTGGIGFTFDQLVGGDGNDILDGRSGFGEQDYLYGNAGNDTFYVDTPADLVFEQANEGTDTVIADIRGAGYYLYANIENLILVGDTPFGVGNALANTITGSDAANWLLGGAGNDILNGGAGNDVLFGEAGADTFVFTTGTGADIIGDFVSGTDKIDLRGVGYTWAQVQNSMHQNGNDMAVDLGNGDLIVLQGVTKLVQADFILAAAASAEEPVRTVAAAVAEAQDRQALVREIWHGFDAMSVIDHL